MQMHNSTRTDECTQQTYVDGLSYASINRTMPTHYQRYSIFPKCDHASIMYFRMRIALRHALYCVLMGARVCVNVFIVTATTVVEKLYGREI